MQTKCINNSPVTYVLVFSTGEEVVSRLTEFATENNLKDCYFTGIGAFQKSVLGYFDFAIKDYKKIPVEEQVELLNLNGNISISDGKPKLHAHVVIGKSDGTAHGGHLLEGIVKPTLELILTESPVYLRRKKDKETGLPLLDLDA
ncbi:MAG TPA: PPC domain-containing DNA-binding protein [Flavipsychrobacter sp.]|nr:PPC domain-containing DNA-binding protein [Flavipsychrobacter sp.]